MASTVIKGCEDVGKDTSHKFEPLVIMEFKAGAKEAAIEWMTSRIQAPKGSGGSGLKTQEVLMTHNKATLLYIGAGTDRLLLAAEMMELKKKYVDGYLHDFTVADLDNFQGSGDINTFLTVAEKQKIILHELEGIRATADDFHIPGYEEIKLYEGKSVVKKYLSREIVAQLFPLHEPEKLGQLGQDWYSRYSKPQPIQRIREYFGEKIAIYFAFLGFYTMSLGPPAVIGVLYFITSWKSVYREAIFAIFNLIWATLFIEAWKRYCAELSYKWGTSDMSQGFEEPRSNYHGTMGLNPVTDKPEPVFPKTKRIMRFYCVTVPVIATFLIIAFYFMLAYFWMQDWADKLYAKDATWLLMANSLVIPTTVYAILIGVLNAIFRKVAMKLNKYENHRLQSSFDNHLILKLVLFDFVNCFMSLFYVAFYIQSTTLLRSHLATLLIVSQIIGQLKESLLPFLMTRRRTEKLSKSMGDVNEDLLKQVNVESTMDPYEGTMDDYLEMFLQFGYVFLFSSVFPLAALWALINNITEVRTDAFKMCRVFQRPFAESAQNIGAWLPAFEVVSILAVMTNCALIAMDPEVRKLLPSEWTAVNIVIVFVAVEHLMLALKAAVAVLIPDVPKWVEIELARFAYQSKQALQKEMMETACARKRDIKYEPKSRIPKLSSSTAL